MSVEPIEPGRGGAWIDRARGRSVFERVPEDVDQAFANLPGRPQRPRVIAIAPESACATGRPVDDACDAGRHPLAAARPGQAVRGRPDHAEGIPLDGGLDQPARELAGSE